ncbi:MAG: hypothetical protein HC810_00960 [Acaryochloridaceae cyanobacterium RL_2_7]|nr:hypothetical protein [Acaryochloridaceae cyanobacterium RL_2_7]
MTLPCHGEDTEYSRGWTRKFLKQILEPLNDVCGASVDGIYQVEQVEQVIGEMLDYLPAQIQGEYDRAIAEMKVKLQAYHQAQQQHVDAELAQYEERRIAECEKTIADLKREKTDRSNDLALMLAAGLIQQRRKYQSLTERQTALLEDFDRKQQQLRQEKTQNQTLQTQLESLQQEGETRAEQTRQSDWAYQQQIRTLQQNRRRDRWIMLGFLALSVGLGVALANELRREPRSPPISSFDLRL